MEIRRFFVSPSDIDGNTVTVRGDEFLHMTKVLRTKKGYKVLICADDGTERDCTVREITGDCAVLDVDALRKVDRRKVRLTLYCGLLKNQKTDIVIQKAVELGVVRIVPFVSANTVEKKFNVERGRRIALEAAKQCGTAYVSEVCEPLSFGEVTARFGEFSDVLFAYEKERENPVKSVVFQGNDVALVVGSEGGFTEEEHEAAKNAGAVSVTLGRRILRAETADIVACALTLDALGELDYDE